MNDPERTGGATPYLGDVLAVLRGLPFVGAKEA